MKGKIIIYTGNGDGKTTAAIGHAIRAAGHGKKIAIIQFMKGRTSTGEYKFLKKFRNRNQHSIDIWLSGPSEFLLSKEEFSKHYKKAMKGMELAKKILREKKYWMLILDECLYAIHYGILKEDEILELLNKRGATHVIITGRYATKNILKISDTVTEMYEKKHHFQKQGKTFRGFDF